jgi:Ion channel
MTSARGEPDPDVKPTRHVLAPGRLAPRGERYGLLLILLVATYILSAFTSGTSVNATQIVAFVGTLLLALRDSLLPERTTRLLAAVVLIGSAVAVGLALTDSQTAIGLAQIWTGLVLLVSAVVIVRRILASTTVTLQSIYGALSAYIVIGLMFAAFYGAMNRLGGVAFFANGQPGNTKTFQYFSFTTLTTLGYGDFTAASNAGRALAVMEAMVGQIFLATLVARLVSAFRPSDPRQ